MHEETSTPHAGCGCGGSDPADAERRRVIRIGAATGAAVALGPLGVTPASARPAAGDMLVADDVEKDPVGIKAADVQPGKPMLAFPFDPASKKIRNDSKLNKVVLVRMAEADFDADTKGRAAGGVLAFSVVCTHQACDAKTWNAADKALVCFCHASKFLVLEGGRVASGPAPRALPMLPLKLQGDQLVVAAPFVTPPGSAG